MPLAQLKGVSGYLSAEQKETLIKRVTDAILSERMRGFGPSLGLLLRTSRRANGASAEPSQRPECSGTSPARRRSNSRGREPAPRRGALSFSNQHVSNS